MQLNSKVDILRVGKASDGMGGWVEAENTIRANLPCRINWSSGSERIQFDKNTYYRDAKLFCRVIDVTVRDRILYGEKKYEVVDVKNVDNRNRLMVLNIRLIE